MARFKFGKKKKDNDADVSTDYLDDKAPYHSYLRRPSVLSRPPVQTPPDLLVEDLAEPEVAAPAAIPNASTPWKRHKLFDSPFPRYRHAALMISSDKNEIFLMGGLKEGSVFGDTWKIVPQLSPSGKAIDGFVAQHIEVANNNNPPARVGHASVLCGNAYIIYGGDTVDTDYNGYPDDNFYMFNINNYKYTIPLHILNKPRGRYGHLIAVVLLNTSLSKLYLFGGQLENDVYNDLYLFELTSFKLPKARWELVEPLNNLRPPPLTNHSMSVYKNKIYVFGGVYNNEKVSNDLWCFDTVINKWLQLATSGQAPLPVNEHSAAVVGDRLFVYGGNDFSGVIYDSLYCLDLHSLKWTKLSKELSEGGPGPRCGHSITYLPTVNKLIIMGGDKNDYIYSNPSDFTTYEEFDGQELGTMIYELDVATADHFMRGGQTKKVAASAGGASGVLNRRTVSPLPSEDALTRHRRSLSVGDDFRTPNASIERFNRSLDPKTDHPGDIDEPAVTPAHELEVPNDKFVDVDIASSSAVSMSERGDDTSELVEVRGRYLATDETEPALMQAPRNGNGHEIQDNYRAENNDTPVLSNDFTHISEFDEPEQDGEAPLFGSTSSPRNTNNNHTMRSALLAGAAATGGAAAGGAALAYGNQREAEPAPSRNLSQRQTNGTRGISSPNQSSENDGKVKKIIAELNSEIAELKASTREQLENAAQRIRALEAENQKLATQNNINWQQKVASLELSLAEKDSMIAELKRSVDPAELEFNEDDTVSTTSGRGFTELTKYKLNRLELSNKLVYLENENAQLKEKHARFEPFMNNQIGELATLQRIIKGQEDRIESLTSQVRLELVLRKEINDWKHKFENLEIEFNNFRAVHADVVISDDEGELSREAGSPNDSMATGATRMTSKAAVSSRLENLILLWQTSSVAHADLRLLNGEHQELTQQLQNQVDELLKTSKQQHEGSSAEVKALESELQAKLASLRTFEDNYRDALQLVKNTSKALNLTQEELQNQKNLIDKLVKENNELKIFKKATSATKRSSTPLEPSGGVSHSATPEHAEEEEDGGYTAAHYSMKLRDLEADLYILKQERDQLNDTVSSLKKELYLAQTGAN